MIKTDGKYTFKYSEDRKTASLVKDGLAVGCAFRGPVQQVIPADASKIAVAGAQPQLPKIIWSNVLCESSCPHFTINRDKNKKRKDQVTATVTCGCMPMVFPIRNGEILEGKSLAINDENPQDEQSPPEEHTAG